MAIRRIQNHEVLFKNLGGLNVPLQPWPQTFYISRELMDICNPGTIELRPLTVTGLIKGVGKNFVSMNYWRFLYLLRKLGFLTTKEGEVFSWDQFTLKFWRTYGS